VDGSIFFAADDGCYTQATMTRNAIIHVNQGDEVYIRTHATNTGDFNIYSDTNGESLFARWLIEKDE
jgi:hypothetical protein